MSNVCPKPGIRPHGSFYLNSIKSWWLHPCVHPLLGHRILLDFLLCQWQLLPHALYLELLLSSNVYMLQDPGFSPQTFSYTYLSTVPGGFMAMKPSLGRCLQKLHLQSDLSLKRQTPHPDTTSISNFTCPSPKSWCHTTLSPTCYHTPVLPTSGSRTTVHPIAQARSLGLIFTPLFLLHPISDL